MGKPIKALIHVHSLIIRINPFICDNRERDRERERDRQTEKKRKSTIIHTPSQKTLAMVMKLHQSTVSIEVCPMSFSA